MFLRMNSRRRKSYTVYRRKLVCKYIGITWIQANLGTELQRFKFCNSF